MRLLLVLCLVLSLAAVELVPGRIVRIPFPDLPDTLAGGTPELHIQVPIGWKPDRPHPVLLWLNGGAGAANINSRYAPGLPFVLVSMPLFKKESTKGTKGTKGTEAVHLDQEDHDLIWKAFSTMLAELDRLVPEQDASRSIVGGFSNGAHCIGVLAGHHPEFVKRFAGYMLCDGGGYMFVNGPKPLVGKKLLVTAGETSPIRSRQQDFADEAKRMKIDNTFIQLAGEGHAAPGKGKALDETIAWVRHRVVYAGLPEAIQACNTAITAKKWPQALAAWRLAAAVVDDQRPEWAAVQQAVPLLDAACGEAIAKLKPTATSKELRAFVTAWQPCQPIDAIRTRADALAREELSRISGDPSARRRDLLRLHGEWARYPVQTDITAALDALASDDLTAAEKETQPATRLKALLRIRTIYPVCPAVERATTAADALGTEELGRIASEKSEAIRLRRLQALRKTYAGLPCADAAAQQIDAIEEAQAQALLDKLLAMPKGPERTRQLKAFVERYAGTEAADRAEKALAGK